MSKAKQCNRAGRPYLLGEDEAKRRLYVTQPNCNTWDCEYCGEENRKRWTARIYHGLEIYIDQGHTFTHVTITSNPKLKTFEATVSKWPHAWSKLYARMKRVKPGLRYALVPEQHKDGRLHVHMLVNNDFGIRWMKDKPAACGLGWMNDSQVLTNAAHGAFYVSKYLGKGLQVENWPKNFRRVRTSHKWPELPQNAFDGDSEVDWYCITSLADVENYLLRFAAFGWLVVDYETGELLKSRSEVALWTNRWLHWYKSLPR